VRVTIPSSHLREAIGRQTVRFRTSRLRRMTCLPFGLTAADTAVMLGDESSSMGLAAEIRAAVTRAPVSLDSISLLYGDCLDLSAPLVEVITRWDGSTRCGDRLPAGDLPPYARELGSAAHRDEAIARGDWTVADGDAKPAYGPFDPGSIDIVISGTLSRVAAVSFRHFMALSFTAQDAEVTVISRHPLPELPRFDPVTDLQPFCSGWARFMEDIYERLYGPPRPSLT
jgi:hypothetical protein